MAEEQRQILIDVELENRDFEQELGNVNKQLKANRDTIKELSKDYQNNAKEIAKLELANKDLSAQKREIIKDEKLQANSLNALRRQLAKLTAERNNLDASLEGNAQKFQELQDEILQTTTKIKGFEQAGGDFRRNVGNYTASVQEALAASGSFGQGIVGLGGQVQGLFTLIKANPIGILITAVTALIGLFARSRKATEFFERAAATLNATFNVLIDRSTLVFNAFSKIISGNVREGFKDLGSAVSGVADEIEREARATDILVAAQQRLRREGALLAAERRQTIAQQEELKNIRDNELLNIKERIEANEKLFQIEDEFIQRQLENARKQLAVKEQLAALRGEENLLEQEFNELVEARQELADIEEESIGRRNEFITNRFQLIQELSQQEVELTEARINGQLQLEEEYSQRSLELQLELIRKRRDLELQAAGENEQRKAIIRQNAQNEEFEVFKEFQENQLEAIRATNKIVEGITKDSVENQLKLIGQQIKADKQAALERQKTAEQTAAIKAQLEAQLLNNTLSILGSIDESGKASALLQIGLSAAQGVAKAVAAGAAAGPPPANLIAIATGISSVLAGIAQARQIFSQSAGAGAGASGSGSAPRVNTGLVSSEVGGNIGLINAGLLSQFSEPLRSEQRTAQSTANAVSNLGPIFVAVTDINKGQRRLNAKVTEARLG